MITFIIEEFINLRNNISKKLKKTKFLKQYNNKLFI